MQEFLKKQKFWRNVKRINKKTTNESLKYSIKDGSAYSVMNGFGRDYLSTFAVALSATNTHLAFLNSLPTLISSIFQLYAAKITDYTGQRMKIILKAILLQALNWLPLFLLPILFQKYSHGFSLIFLIFFVTVSYVLEAMTIPAWNSLMGDIVKENERGRYFGLRNKITGSVAFASVVIAGLILSLFEGINIWIGFGILFSVACIARLISYQYMKEIYEPKYKIALKKKYNIIQFMRSMKETNFGRFVNFNAIFKFVVNIASPFFVPFLLLNAGFSYLQLTIALSAATVSSFLVMLYWGRNADVFGNKKIMIVCGLLIPLIPLLWVINHSFYFIIFVQCLSGFVWSGYNLASSNFIFDTVSPEKRARGVAFYNLAWGIAVFVGSMIGAFLSNVFPAKGIGFMINSNYEMIFLISAILRFTAMAVYMNRFKEVRKVEPADVHVLFFKLVAVRPLSGMVVSAVGSLDFTYKQVKKHYKKPYEFTSKHLSKPYEFVKKNVHFDELLKGK
ncbi:MFS transporter [Candidatus Woesearchaeota archaeon]|jgi:MFS family permease|nr:MFS transporter [Candidatus Woesearchaeota archaeon]